MVKRKELICPGNIMYGKHSPDSVVKSIPFPASKWENRESEKSSDGLQVTALGSGRTKISSPASPSLASLVFVEFCFWSYRLYYNYKPRYCRKSPMTFSHFHKIPARQVLVYRFYRNGARKDWVAQDHRAECRNYLDAFCLRSIT